MDDLYAAWDPSPGDRMRVVGTRRTGMIRHVTSAGVTTLCEVAYDRVTGEDSGHVESWTHPVSELEPIDATAFGVIWPDRAR